MGLTAPLRSVNISHGCHPILSEEELLSFFELRNYESSNSSLKTAAEFIDEYVLPSRGEADQLRVRITFAPIKRS